MGASARPALSSSARKSWIRLRDAYAARMVGRPWPVDEGRASGLGHG